MSNGETHVPNPLLPVGLGAGAALGVVSAMPAPVVQSGRNDGTAGVR